MTLFKKFVGLLLGSILSTATIAQACSHITYTGKNDRIITGRSMDWANPMHTNLWALPAGLKHNGKAGPNSIKWTSKYGSVVAVVFGKVVADGVNTAGLSVSLLYLSQSQYPTLKKDQPNISTLMWAQYILDNFASVDDIVSALKNKSFNVVAPPLPGGYPSSVHLVATDKTGNNVIIEFVNGKLTIHQGKQYNVVTNNPIYSKQLAQNQYWQSLQGDFLPGTSKSQDRFARAWYYLHHANPTSDPNRALAIVLSIIRNVSVPISDGMASNHPNIAPTLWRSAADLKNKTYYFEPTSQPNIFWVNMHDLNLKQGGSVQELDLQKGQIYSGNVADAFKPAQQFQTPDAFKLIQANQATS